MYRRLFTSNAFKKIAEEHLSKLDLSGAAEQIRVVGEAGGGMVRATMLGTGKLERIEIDPEVKEKAPAALESLIVHATNNAVDKVEKEFERLNLALMHEIASDSEAMKSIQDFLKQTKK
jgi:DNA-binding YbaB/EbfC family protein